MTQTHTYRSSDIHVAATLLVLGHEIQMTTRDGGQFGGRAKAVFHFEESDKLRQDLLGYTNNSLRLSPRDLFSRLRELKSLCHNPF